MKQWSLCATLTLLLVLSGCGASSAWQREETPSDRDSEKSEAVEETRGETEDSGGHGGGADYTDESAAEITGVTISFDYEHRPTSASNQFAVWIEDINGGVVKTLFATSFTAGRRGYRQREMSLSAWVAAARPEERSDRDLDAVSGATPGTGRISFSWDLTDEDGNRAPDGVYRAALEGTLYWGSNVLYTASFEIPASETGSLEVQEVRSEPDNSENETMIGNVSISLVGESEQEVMKHDGT